MLNRILKSIERVSFIGMLVTLVFLSTMASMCDDDDNKSRDIDDTELNNALRQGTWRITSFVEYDNDETSDFSGYTFTFGEGGSARAVKNSTSIPGLWSTENSSNGTVKFILNFGSTDPLDELDEDWKVVSQTSSRIALENVSGGDGHLDRLTFEKN